MIRKIFKKQLGIPSAGRWMFVGILAMHLVAPCLFGQQAKPLSATDEFHPTRIIAKLKPVAEKNKSNMAASQDVFKQKKLKIHRQFKLLPDVVVLDVEDTNEVKVVMALAKADRAKRLNEKMDELRASGLFEYVQPDYVVHLNSVPNDSAFQDGTLWGLRNIGISNGVPGADISATNAWDITTGSTNVIVAVIDTGINYNHLELAPQMWRNPGEIAGNGVDDDSNGYVDDVFGINAITRSGDPLDDNGHGSHCAGTIGAAANDGHPHVGVAWKVRLMACKSFDSTGKAHSTARIDCIGYAVTNGAKILNNSWGSSRFDPALSDAIAVANAHNVLFVAAAGNGNDFGAIDTDRTPFYPACYNLDNVISVTSLKRNNRLDSEVNYGATGCLIVF